MTASWLYQAAGIRGYRHAGAGSVSLLSGVSLFAERMSNFYSLFSRAVNCEDGNGLAPVASRLLHYSAWWRDSFVICSK